MLEASRVLFYLICVLIAVRSASAGDSSEFGAVNMSCNAGGTMAPGNMTFMVALLKVPFKKEAYCVGTIITPHHVLISARCRSFFAFFKEINVLGTNRKYYVQKVMRHKLFVGRRIDYNIAIVITKKRIEFNNFVGPACLLNQKLNLTGKEVVAMGEYWQYSRQECVNLQHIETGGSANSSHLNEVNLTIVDHQKCKNEYYGYSDSQNLCTSPEGKDLLMDSPGGPLFWLNPETDRFILIGIISGRRGSSKPGMNTDVYYFLPWIKDIIKDKNVTLCMQ